MYVHVCDDEQHFFPRSQVQMRARHKAVSRRDRKIISVHPFPYRFDSHAGELKRVCVQPWHLVWLAGHAASSFISLVAFAVSSQFACAHWFWWFKRWHYKQIQSSSVGKLQKMIWIFQQLVSPIFPRQSFHSKFYFQLQLLIYNIQHKMKLTVDASSCGMTVIEFSNFK